MQTASIFKITLFLATNIYFSINNVSGQKKVYNVLDFGARGDTVTDNRIPVQKAIDACSQTGGEVYFPPGTFLTSTLFLKSNVTLYLSAGAVILGHDQVDKYPALNAGFSFYGDQWAKYSLIFCKEAENVSIRGEGLIDGQGASFASGETEASRYNNRPFLLWFVNCKNVSVKNIRLRNSAFWMQYYLSCEKVAIEGIDVWNHSNKNNDMLDIDGCRDVIVSDVTGDSDDDGITIKSTSPRISENIIITNCVISSHCNAIKFGTESTGGFKKIIISDCVIKPSKQRTVIYGKPDGISGVALETVDGGIIENINIHSLVIDGPGVPIFVRLGNRARKYTETAATPPAGKIRQVSISDIIATGAGATGCSITGLPGAPIKHITLRDISIEFSGSNMPDSVFNVPEKETAYPEATMFGDLPAYGFYIRHTNDLKFINITTRCKNREDRPGVIIADTDGFRVQSADIWTSPVTKAALQVYNSKNGLVEGCRSKYPGKKFLFLDTKTKNIKAGQ